MPIDFSKFGEFAASIQQKVDAALQNDNKVSENEIKQMNLSKELEKALREELSKNPGMYEDAFVISKKDDKARHTLKLDKGKAEGPLNLSKDSIEYYKKNYPEAEIASAYLKNGVVYLQNRYGEQAIDKSGQPIKYSFAKQEERGSVDLVSYYLEHNNGVFDLNKFNNIRAVQERINSAPEISESYAELMNSIEFEQADEQRKTEMLFEQSKKNLANASNMGEVMQNLFSCVMLNCQVLDHDLKIVDFRNFFNRFYGLDKIADAMRNVVDDNNEENLSKLENVVEETIGFAKGAEAFVTSTQLLAFIGMLGAASACSESVGLGEVFAIATTGFFGYEAGSMGVDGFLAGLHADTKEEAEAAGEQLGAAALMLLGVAKGGKRVVDNALENHSVLDTSADFNIIKEKLKTATTREALIKIGETIKTIEFTPAEKLELNKEFFKKTLEFQSQYTEIQRGVLNMYKGEITPKVAERNDAIRKVLEDAIENGEKLTLKVIAERTNKIIEGSNTTVADVQNSIYNPRFGLKSYFDKVNSRSGKAEAEFTETIPPELKEIAGKQPEVLSMLMNIKKSDGTRFHSIEDIKTLAEESKRMPGFVKILSNQKNAEGEPRFTAGQIKNIIQLYYKEPVLAKKLVYTTLSNSENFKYSAECVETVAKTFENGTGVKKALARKMINDNPSVFPEGEVPEDPSEFIVAELTKVVKRGRPKKEAAQETEAQEGNEVQTPAANTGNNAASQGNVNPSTASEIAISPSSQSVVSGYEFKKPYYKTSATSLRYDSYGTSETLFEVGEKRLFNWIKNLKPHSSTPEPIVVSVGDNHLGFTIKKTLDNRTVVTVKNWLGDKESWDKTAFVEEVLNFELDENGKLVSGNVSWNDFYENADPSEYSYTFRRSEKGNGIITYKKQSYGGRISFRKSITPWQKEVEVFEQSPENPALWYPKSELDQVRSQQNNSFNLSEDSYDMATDALSYSSEKSGLMNLLLNLAGKDRPMPVDRKAAFRMSDARSEESGGGTATRVRSTEQSQNPPKVNVEFEDGKVRIATEDSPKPVETVDNTVKIGTDYEFKKVQKGESEWKMKEQAEATKKAAFDKMESILPEIINSVPKGEAMDKPIVIQAGLNRIGIMVDKTKTGGNTTTVTIKHWLGDKEAWDKFAKAQQTLQYKIDKNGKLLKAEIFWTERYKEGDASGMSYHFNSTRDGNILINHVEKYFPDNNYEYPRWTRTSTYEPSSADKTSFECTSGNARVTETSIAFDSNETGLFNTFMGLFKSDNLNLNDKYTYTKKPVAKVDAEAKAKAEAEADAEAKAKAEAEAKAKAEAEAKAKAETEAKAKAREEANAKAAADMAKRTEETIEKLNKMGYQERIKYIKQKETELINKALTKMKNYLGIVSNNSKMGSPVTVDVDGYFRMTFSIDKTQEGITTISARFNNEKLSFNLDENGQMTSARLFIGQNTYSFLRGAQGTRRIFHNGVEYQPIGKAKGQWTPVKGRLSTSSPKYALDTDEYKLLKMMIDLTEPKTYLK